MSQTMSQPPSLLDKWIQENNELVNKCKECDSIYDPVLQNVYQLHQAPQEEWNNILQANMNNHISILCIWLCHDIHSIAEFFKQQEDRRDTVSRDHNHPPLGWCSSEFHRLLRKIQGIPPNADHTQLELMVVYNAGVCSAAQSQFSEAELFLTQAAERVLQMTGGDAGALDPLVRWRTVLESVRDTALHPPILYLLCLQWAIWLATCQLKTILEFQEEMSSLFETLCGGVGDGSISEARPKSSNLPTLVMDPRRLIELLQMCTSIALGAEQLNEGRSSEALSGLQAASSLPAPRALVSYTHLLSGSCLTHMRRPQMALQCYRKALETDSHCVCALYQSMLIYRQLGNTQAEIQALRLLHSTLMLPSATDPALASTHLLSPASLLHSQSLSSLLSVPSALSVLHSLALKCVLHGRVSEGVEYYLDLLAVLHSEEQQGLHTEDATLPRLPELYLEAAAALLMARRPADCLALCSEVISTTLELLPEKVVLEEPEERSEAKTTDMEGENRVAMVLWTAAAYLLQGHCHAHLKDWKQAVTHYTRCTNLLVKVRLKKRDFQPQILSEDVDVKRGKDLCILQRLKGLSLACRGISFTQIDKLKEALRDLQLGLQAFPECVGAGLWCGEVLWRLSRRQEAAACWEKTWSVTAQSLVESLPVYLQEPQSGPLLDSAELRHRIQELGLT